LRLFITFEGGEGCGKSTQARTLLKSLHQQQIPAILTYEPGGTFLGQLLRQWIASSGGRLPIPEKNSLQLSLIEEPIGIRAEFFEPDAVLHSTTPRAELLAFLIARAQLVDEVIRPNLDNGNVVLCDRFADSTVAYQGYGRGLDLSLIKTANRIATQRLKPNLTVLLDLAPEQGLIRKWSRDQFEAIQLDFHRRVREGYLKMAAAEPERWLVIDATLPKNEIANIIWERVSLLLPPASSLQEP
jgi:dTMP kinase